MCRKRIWSSGGLILHHRLRHDMVAEILAEKTGCVEVHFSPQKRGEFAFHGEEPQPHGNAGLKLHQHVDVAVGAEIISQNSAEQRQLANAVSPAEFGNIRGRYVNPVKFHEFALGNIISFPLPLYTVPYRVKSVVARCRSRRLSFSREGLFRAIQSFTKS